MQTETILLIIAAGIIALIIALYQYLYRAKNRKKKLLFFAFLRFLSVFFTISIIN